MQFITLYISTAAIFLALDAVMLRFVMKPLFEQYIGGWLLTDIRMLPALGFYLFYVFGILWFASIPAVRSDQPVMALLSGAILGAVAYGTYEFTNYATLKSWSLQMLATDLTWGVVLTATSAYLGVLIARTV